LTGTVSVPGDKSISHRALILSALAPGAGRITGLNTGTDVLATVSCLRRLGAELQLNTANHKVEVKGFGRAAEPRDVLDAANSGTTLRTLAGVCAGIPGMSVLTGDDTLRRRPMARIVEPLRAMGAVIDGREGGTLPPLYIRGGKLHGIDHRSPIASAQVKTCLLLAGLSAVGPTSVTEPRPSRDHTERMLLAAGVPVAREGTMVTVPGGSLPEPRDWVVPGDLSSAFFLIAAAVLVPGSDLTITGVGLNPTRVGALAVLRAMGADIDWAVDAEEVEPSGTVTVRHSTLTATTIEAVSIPGLLDEVPALALLATQAEGTTEFAGIAELRVKESDRIATMTAGLRALGAHVDAEGDVLRVTGPAPLSGGTVDSQGDHRIALSFAVAALIADSDVRITGWSAVETSFPEFLDLLAGARRKR
jgi:3-phosphoshikimate 1-carboxyvinyltransferase